MRLGLASKTNRQASDYERTEARKEREVQHAWTYVSMWAEDVGGLAVIKVEVLRIEVERWHVAKMTLMLRPQVQAAR